MTHKYRFLKLFLLIINGPSWANNFIGHVQTNNPINVVAKIDGFVDHVTLDVGDTVKENELLVSINQVDFKLEKRKAAANLALAKATVAIKKATYDRYVELHKNKNVSENELDVAITDYDIAIAEQKLAEINLEKAELDLSRTTITAQNSGYVSQRKVEQGSWVSQGTQLYQLVNINRITVQLFASEFEINKLTIGQEIQVWSEESPTVKVTATIKRIGVELSEGSFAYPVLIEIDNKKQLFKPGMSMHATTEFEHPSLSDNTSIDNTSVNNTFVNNNSVNNASSPVLN